MGKKRRSATSEVAEKKPGSSSSATNSNDQADKGSGNNNNNESFGFIMMTLVGPAMVTAVLYQVSPKEREDRAGFAFRLIYSMVLDTVYSAGLYSLMLRPTRAIARRLPGALVPADHKACEAQEQQQNDPALTWPLEETKLASGWQEAAKKRSREKDEPLFFLNHVRGSTRIRQAIFRVASALGTLLMVSFMSRWVDFCNLSDIGLTVSPVDLVLGFIVGSTIVIILFLLEVGLGWIKIVKYGEVVVEGESLSLNLLWDVFFHLGVSIAEEVSMRGWILVHTAGFIASFGYSASHAMILSVALQASLFALMHLGSPGATVVGLTNLVLGGTVGALNVFLSGGLSFSLGWHFGWNIFMGHLLGLSTSGIPMSAKLVSIVPHPEKAQLHGGRFGPEQSPLAPLAYFLGFVALWLIYGSNGIDAWGEKLLHI